ncbi:hypothetical protein KA005_59210, partial [bacterium]|nr:hypothetical protein [bacterium]
MYNNEAIRTIEEIKLSVLKLLNNQLTFSDKECRETLNSCGISGTVEKKGNNTYILTKSTQKKLKKAYKSTKQGEKDFDQGLSGYVGRRLDTVIDPFAEALLCKIVKETIQSIFFRNAIKLRKLLEEQSDLASLLESDIDAEKELGEKLTTFISIQSDATVEATIEGIKRFMANLNDVQRHYIATLHHRVFYFQILNIDPRLQKIQDACFKFLRIYLDTNVLVRYLCDGSSLHEPITDIVTMARKLGVRILISSKTLLETERLVNAARSFSGYLEDSQIGTALLSSPIAMSNPIIEAFIAKRRLNPRLKWSGYASRFVNLEIFLVTEDIEVNDDGFSNITEDDSYPLVHRAVSDVKGLLISPEVINHDTYNIVLVQNLRNKYPATMLGSSVWLLTIDSKLPRVDKKLRRAYPNPHCKTLDQLGGVLLPFQNIDKYIATDEYISYLVSHQLGAIFPEEVLDIQFF